MQSQDARTIATQTSGKAYGGGEIDVDKFVKAHEFEIKALEDGMQRSKKFLSKRAFQEVPRDMRRRTASHNVKKVPKRLQKRARKEVRGLYSVALSPKKLILPDQMAEDNTPDASSKKRKLNSHARIRDEKAQVSRRRTSKLKSKQMETKVGRKGADDPISVRAPKIKRNSLQKPPQPKAKFRKRQIHKAWLPTHVFHAKRAHMTPPKEPLWRTAIPLTPNAKVYRPTHRASTTRGAVAWDMSYMATLCLEGFQTNLENVLSSIGVFSVPTSYTSTIQYQRWKGGTRSWHGWVHDDESKRPIAPATVLFCPRSPHTLEQNELARESFTRSKRSRRKVFVRVHPAAFLQLWEVLLKLCKAQSPPLIVEDLRFEIGCIEIAGPASFEALVGTLKPTQPDEENSTSTESPEEIWSSLGALTNPSSLPQDVILAFDISDPRLRWPPRPLQRCEEHEAQQNLLRILSEWPLDKTQWRAGIFDRKARLTASRCLLSQKAINRRKGVASPGEYPVTCSKDPNIPVLLFTNSMNSGKRGGLTALLPWKCVLPTWYCIMYYPLTTGGTVNFGGLDEKRQIAFEAGSPWFPADFPGVSAGMSWELQQRAKRRMEWERKPRGRRVQWESIKLGNDQVGELGLGWACDWQFLLTGSSDIENGSIKPRHQHLTEARKRLARSDSDSTTLKGEKSLCTVRVKSLSRGVPTTCARIYRLPTTCAELRGRWLCLLPSALKSAPEKPLKSDKQAWNAPAHQRRQALAQSLLDPAPILCQESDRYPPVPGKEDLIGFITTGNFNLAEGRGTGIGCITLDRITGGVEERQMHGPQHTQLRHVCIVREAGQSMGRLARWELV